MALDQRLHGDVDEQRRRRRLHSRRERRVQARGIDLTFQTCRRRRGEEVVWIANGTAAAEAAQGLIPPDSAIAETDQRLQS